MFTVSGENIVKCLKGFSSKKKKKKKKRKLGKKEKTVWHCCSAKIANKITQSPSLNFERVLKGAEVSFYSQYASFTTLQIYKFTESYSRHGCSEQIGP